ncbi:very short patch repair endonuclease, partial [Acinetobacter baumannii]|nr:very short patch repair endonuclease [Acinetobacter baumannii]
MTSGGSEGPSWASSPVARATMRGNRDRDTKPELAVRRRLHAAGLRYR